LIFQAFFVFLLFQKKRIEGGKKFKRKNIFSGDFDVFASCLSGNPRINSLIAAKKQRKKKTPTHHKLSLCSDCNPSDFHSLRSEPIYSPCNNLVDKKCKKR